MMRKRNSRKNKKPVVKGESELSVKLNIFIKDHSRVDSSVALLEEFEIFSNFFESLNDPSTEEERQNIRDFLLWGYQRYALIERDNLSWAENLKSTRGFEYIDAIQKALRTLQNADQGYLYLDESHHEYSHLAQEIWSRYQACLDVKLEVFPSQAISLFEKIRSDVKNGDSQFQYEIMIHDLSFLMPKTVTRHTDDFNWTYVILGGLIRLFANAIGIDSQYRVVLVKQEDQFQIVAIKHLNPKRFLGVDVYEYSRWKPESESWIFDTDDGRTVRMEFPIRDCSGGLSIWQVDANLKIENIMYPANLRDQAKWMRLIRFFCKGWVSFEPPFVPGLRLLGRSLRLRMPARHEN